MDDCRFDNWTRLFQGIQDRRTALKQLGVAGAALLSVARAELGLAAEEDVQIEGCRLTNERCSKNKQCCSNNCHRKKHKKRNNNNNNNNNNGGHKNKNKNKKGDGKCQCAGNGKSCNKDAACCKGFCDPNDKRCRCVAANNTCNKDDDCCENRKCVDNGGNKVCKNR